MKLIGKVKPIKGVDYFTDEEIAAFFPPMQIGVEYQTSELWQGKPIYTKLIRADELPEDTSTQIDISAENIEYAFIDLANTWVGYENDPGTNYAADSASVPSIRVSGGLILITLAALFDNVTAIVSVKYTKTTD